MSKGTTEVGYVNRNDQQLIAQTGRAGNDLNQKIYILHCQKCGHEYGSNGSDNFQRRCPQCQGGRRGLSTEMISGTIVGYDPGGEGNHGLAFADVEDGVIKNLSLHSLKNAEAVIQTIKQLAEKETLIAIGIDTLTCWSTGKNGWRPADQLLREHYPNVTNSVASPNSLYGSMGLNGMSVAMAFRVDFPALEICETHPKVLYYALSKHKYDYEESRTKMDEWLWKQMGIDLAICDYSANDHEWDAVISCYAVLQRLLGCWALDLHDESHLQWPEEMRKIEPCGTTSYPWPDFSSKDRKRS